MKVIQELVAYFERRGRLTRAEIRKLLDQGLAAGDAPLNMRTLCDPIGATYYFRVTGDAAGTLVHRRSTRATRRSGRRRFTPASSRSARPP